MNNELTAKECEARYKRMVWVSRFKEMIAKNYQPDRNNIQYQDVKDYGLNDLMRTIVAEGNLNISNEIECSFSVRRGGPDGNDLIFEDFESLGKVVDEDSAMKIFYKKITSFNFKG